MAFVGFTERELDVLALFVNGARPTEIAELLGISRQRVHELLKGVYSKAGVHEASALKQWAVECCLNETLAAAPGFIPAQTDNDFLVSYLQWRKANPIAK